MKIGTRTRTWRRNAEGEAKGWNSTSYETVTHWMNHAGIGADNVSMADAKLRLRDALTGNCSAEAMGFFTKVLGL